MPGYWNSKSDIEVKVEITQQLSINSLDFIGRYRKHTNGFAYFDNIRLPNFSPLPKIKSNKDDKLANTKVIVQRKDLKNGLYYHFKGKVIPKNHRVKHNNEFIFTVDNDYEIVEYKPDAKDFIDSIYDRFDKADSANNNDISKALNTITYQINKKPETFIYELLQNADDNAGIKDVNVTFFITDKYLLVFHNGDPFKFNNVFAICSVNAEDKSDDIDKIGFKGIGFKSVFKDNDWVFINSGEYSFRFDQSKYSVEKPWQLMPIWTPVDDDLEISIRKNERFLSENVSIALRPKDNDIKLLSKYSKTLEQFNDDRILLFLKKVRQVHVSLQNKEKIHCRKNNAIWGIREYTIGVNNEIKNWLNEQIRNNNQEVPIKYQDIDKFKISYAYKVDNNKVLPIVDSTLFNYLPLSISLGFPFLVNSDFIPDGDREELYLNAWNEYLMIEIGRNLLVFISDIINSNADCFNLLPESAKNNFLNSKWNQLYEWFLQGYIDSLKGDKPIAFIPTNNGKLEVISNILIDETGLANLLGEEFFQLTGISGKLIHTKVGEGISKIKDLINEYQVGLIYDKDRLKEDLKANLEEWLKVPKNNLKFIEHINSSDSLKDLLKSEDIILSSDGVLCKAPNLFAEVPAELTFLLPKKVNNEVLKFIKDKKIKLDFKIFEPIQFLSENIVGKEESINAGLDNETKLLYFWQFVFNNWEVLESDKAIINCLKSIEILCKSSTPDKLLKCVISKTYLSAEYNLTNEIESTVRSIIQDAHFISDKNITKSGDELKWRKMFNKLSVIGDLQKTIDDLLPKLSSINEQQHYIITKQIFKYWKDNKEKETKLTKDQIELIRNNLKLKCIDNVYRETYKSIISDHFQTNKIIGSVLTVVSLNNQISPGYSNSQISEWNTFFKEIGCISLDEKQQVLDVKISHIVNHQADLDEVQHFSVLKCISDLHKNQKENGLSFDFEKSLFQIKLQTRNNEWHLPKGIHLSNSYKPKLSLQDDDAINSTLLFLNEKYQPNEIEKYFLTEMGVNDSFKFYTSEIKRSEIAVDYLNSIEIKYPAIALNANAGWGHQHNLINHIDLNYKNLLCNYKYSEIFWQEVVKANSKHTKVLFMQSNYKWAFGNSVMFENYVVNYIKQNATLPNQENELKKSTELFSFLLSEYITEKNELPKFNLSEIHLNNDQSKSLEDILGVRILLSQSHCIELLSRIENRLSFEEIKQLQIVEILSGYSPTDDEKSKLFLLNQSLEWKAINELFISTDNQFQIEPTQNLHEYFYPIAECFGIQELSEENLVLITSPITQTISDEIKSFFERKAKYIAYKIDHLNYDEVEALIIEKIKKVAFFEVNSISKVFPEIKPIYKSEIAFHFEDDEDKIFYKGNWKTNSELKIYLHKHILEEKIPEAWFENVINRWDEYELIELLIGEYGSTPFNNDEDYIETEEKTEKGINTIKDILPDASDEEITYISEIINIRRDKDGQIDANTTAKIKTIKYLKANRDIAIIADKGLYLQVDGVKTIVRSAQKGLLYLDLYDWGELNEANVKIAIYTNSEITIFDSQEALYQFCKPQNTFGVLRMPNDYSLDDYNNLNDIKEKSKWHFVFIVNKDAKAAKSYEELLNLDDYNNYG